MASTYGFCSSPSISTNFSYPIVSQSTVPNRRTTQISLQESASNSLQLQNSNLSQFRGKETKTYRWVNPKNPKPSNAHTLRHAHLTAVAESLNSCSTGEKEVFDILDRSFGGKLEPKDGVIILNNIVDSQTARIVLKYVQDICDFRSNLILYNVTLKVFRNCKDLRGAEQLFDEMLDRGIKPDNATFSTIIGCARMSALPSKAVAWFERMPEFGIEPDDATNAVMIDAYGRVGNVKMALQLYDRAKLENWSLSTTTYTTLIRIHGTSRNFDGCLTVFEEMKALGIKPNFICYNTLLDALCRAKIPWEIKSIHQEIQSRGLNPGFATYASLLRAYCKSLCGEDAMNVYREMMAKGMELNTVLYNTLLSMCSFLGLVDEAMLIFEDMKRSMYGHPDSRSFSYLITIFSNCGKVLEAEAALKEMSEAGFEHDVYILTSLTQCYWKSNRLDDVVKTLNRILDLGLSQDERYCMCLVKVMAWVPREEMGKIMRCIERGNQKLGNVVKMVVESNVEDEETFKIEAKEVVDGIGDGAKKTYCKSLIDLCNNLEKPEKARYLETLL